VKITAAMRRFAVSKNWVSDNASDQELRDVLASKLAEGAITAEVWAMLVKDRNPLDGRALLQDLIRQELQGNGGRRSGLTPSRVGSAGGVRLKNVSEAYRVDKAPARHRKSNQPVLLPSGSEALRSSEAEQAMLGSWLKWKARKSGQSLPTSWSEHDQALLDELIHEEDWLHDDGVTLTTLSGGDHVKAVLDDSTSGGTNLVPLLYDDAIIVGLLTHSEIAPYVDLKNIGKGRQIQTPTVGIPSMVWGTPEGTALGVLDTTNLIGQLPSTVFTLSIAIEFGKDLLADSAYSVGQVLEEAIGMRVASELDKVIVLGDGVTQPLGIMNTAGVATVASVNGAGGPVAVGDAESLIFGVAKPYRAANLNPSFIGNDVVYRRFKAIPTATGANDRVFGMDTQGYQVFEFPFKVASNLANTVALFCALRKYRLWTREAAEPVYEEGGKELRLKNLSLLIVRGRFAGRLLDSAAAVKMTTLVP